MANVPGQGANGSQAKNGTTKNTQFTGFAPSFGVNVNVTKSGSNGGGRGQSAAAGQSAGGSHFVLGEPQFDSAEDVRNYCNHVRALMLQVSIELAMAAKILEARLSQAQQLPGDNPIQGRLRAAKVGRKLKKAADGSVASAKGAVAAYGAFTREYADLMRPRPQRPAASNPFKF